MQGQKQIFTFVVILVVICSFTFFRNAIRKDKQFRRIREEALRKKLETTLDYNDDNSDAVDEPNHETHNNDNYLYKLLEYENICYDLHAIIFKPEKEIEAKQARKDDEQRHENTSQFTDSKHKKGVVTGPLVYLFIIILIYSFIKAATDMSKQLSKKTDDDENGIRRYSLQEYANTKKHRRSSRGPVLRRATTLTTEHRPSSNQQSFEERRKSYMISDFGNGSGLITEPGTPPKTFNGIAHGSVLRRPSIDSFSEDDSSPDVKRRVRMIHRH
ncbi:uncharacterized protein LOC119655028 isoform X2 [Hermetia illucens]|uniref:uncharacterized protein LOC119655028 isoform X2 n=1 Tax=Hermetia illucens TaxID=343691 RepID=UPI0018CBF57C|nr:uncharacterized protein LOC119655028 isoform X2 [Hermetia illucens]